MIRLALLAFALLFLGGCVPLAFTLATDGHRVSFTGHVTPEQEGLKK